VTALRIVVLLAAALGFMQLLWKAIDAGRALAKTPDAPVDIAPLARHYELMASLAAVCLSAAVTALLAGKVLTSWDQWWVAPALLVPARVVVAVIVRAAR
jgi:hypothetical protein